MQESEQTINVTKLENIEVDGINMKDYPDFCDAFISSAELNGRELTDEELEKVNEDSSFVHNEVIKFLY